MSGAVYECKIMKNIKYIVSVLFVAFLVYIFTFYIDGEMGVILLAFVLFAPLVSLGFALYARKNVKVTIDCDAYVKKGSKLKVRISVEKKNSIPLAVLEIKPFVSEVFDRNVKTFKLSLMEYGRKEFVFETDAVYGGNGEVGISELYSSGFLGFIRFRLDNIPERILVGVIPEVPDVKASSSLIRSIANVVATTENEEDNETSMMFSSNTTPGYEHREYVQGDPLKRINWKLSSKRSALMVRLDEAAASVQPVIILDLYRPAGIAAETAVITEEKIISSVFGLLQALIRQGVASTFIFRSDADDMETVTVDNPDYPAQILLKVLAVKVHEGSRADVSAVNEGVCACIIATTDTGAGFETVSSRFAGSENLNLIVASPSSANGTSHPTWYLDEDNNFKLV